MGYGRYVYEFEKDGPYRFLMENSQDGKQWARFMEGPTPASSRLQAKTRASVKAAAAARPPTSVVCSALRTGLAPVKCPFTQPNITRAPSVTATEVYSAVAAL